MCLTIPFGQLWWNGCSISAQRHIFATAAEFCICANVNIIWVQTVKPPPATCLVVIWAGALDVACSKLRAACRDPNGTSTQVPSAAVTDPVIAPTSPGQRTLGALKHDRAAGRPPGQEAPRPIKTGAGVALGGGGGDHNSGSSGAGRSHTSMLTGTAPCLCNQHVNSPAVCQALCRYMPVTSLLDLVAGAGMSCAPDLSGSPGLN